MAIQSIWIKINNKRQQSKQICFVLYEELTESEKKNINFKSRKYYQFKCAGYFVYLFYNEVIPVDKN